MARRSEPRAVVGAPDRDERPRELELAARRDRLREPDAAQALVELGGVRVLAAPRGRAREPEDRRVLQRIELERAPPRELGVVAREQAADHRERVRGGAMIAALLGEPRDLAPRGHRRDRIGALQDRRGHLVHGRIVGRQLARRGELVLRARGIVGVVHEHVGEAQPQLHRARRRPARIR